MMLDWLLLIQVLLMASLNQIRLIKIGSMKFINYMVIVHLDKLEFKISNQTGIR